MTLVVLAAGMGSRYGGLKQVDPITAHGEFIIDFSVYDAIRAGYDKVVFIIKRENEEIFRKTIGSRLEDQIEVCYVYQETTDDVRAKFPPERVKPLGTAHALLCAASAVKGPFSVINADDFYGASAYRLAKEYLTNAQQAGNNRSFCMVGYTLRNTLTEHGTVARGICKVDENAYLRGITERTKIRKDPGGASYLEGDTWFPVSADSTASMNFFGFHDSIFGDLAKGFEAFLADSAKDPLKGEYFLPSVVSAALAARSCDVKVLVSEDRWFGVTYQEDKPMVTESIRAMINAGIYPDGLWR